MCWLPYLQNFITGNTPYGTGNATHTGNVRCPYRYCTPLYFMFFLANALRYVPIQSLSKFSYYPQCQQYRYCHCNVRRHFWYGNAEKLQYRYCYWDTRCQFRCGNQENYSTITVIATKDVSTGMVIHKITVPVLSLQRKTSFPVW